VLGSASRPDRKNRRRLNTGLAKVIAVAAVAVAIQLVAGWVAKSPEAAVSE
jgi:hypothetical protein